LAATVKLTLPGPLPLAGALTVSQPSLVVAVHAQPAGAVTAIGGVDAPPAAGTVRLVGLIVTVQPPDCVTVNVCPPIESVPTRSGPALAATLKLTLPLPVPLAGALTVSQPSLVVAVHAQPAGAVTAIGGVDAPPAAGTVRLVGLIVTAQPPDCVTVNVWPPIVSVPVRSGPAFAPALNSTLPLPVPLAPAVIVSHGSFLVAVHVQPAGAVTAIGGVDGPPAAGTVRLVGLIVTAQPPDCVTVNVWPPIVNVPVRSGPALAATLNSTPPLPVPLAPAVIVSQAAWLVAVQSQPAGAVTAIGGVEGPPLAGTVRVAGLIDTPQPLCCVTVNVWPPIVSVPMRSGPGFAPTVKPTVLLPLPLGLELIVSHGTWLVAVHAQPAAAVRLTGAAAPPVAVTVRDAGTIENAQPLAWLTVNVCPAMSAVPLRAGPGFAATESVTGPVLEPVAPDAIVIHTAWETADQGQPAGVVTVTA